MLTIGRLARAAGVNVETVRYYQRIGLLDVPPRPAHGIREYREQDLAQLRFIKSAQRVGFALNEVGALLRLQGTRQCAEAKMIAERRLADVRSRMEELARLETVLQQLVDGCASAQEVCPLVAALHQ